MEDVLEFLLQPGWQVDVLRAEVFTEPDGRRVVELSPVARSVVPQRIVDSPAWARGLDPDPFPAPFDPTPLTRPVPLIVPPSFAVPLTQLDTDAPDPLLAAVAAALAGPAVLVWAPEGAAECLEALRSSLRGPHEHRRACERGSDGGEEGVRWGGGEVGEGR